MCKFIGKSNEQILCKLNKSEILRLYSIVHVAMETTTTSNFTCHSKSFISTFFTCQVSACELQPFPCHDLANDIYSQTTKTVFSLLNWLPLGLRGWTKTGHSLNNQIHASAQKRRNKFNPASKWPCLSKGRKITATLITKPRLRQTSSFNKWLRFPLLVICFILYIHANSG